MSLLIEALNNYRNGVKVESFGSAKSQIRTHTFDRLGRVFNDGHGFLVFAEKEDGILYINSILLSKNEIIDIEANLTNYVLVELGYPDYYNFGLITVLKKKENETKKYNEFMKQFETDHV